MARLTLNYRTLGLANNTNMTAGSGGNAACPDYFDTVLAQNGGLIQYKTADNSFLFSSAIAGDVAQIRRTTSFPLDNISVEIEYNGTAHPTTEIRLLELRSTDAGSLAARVNLKSNGQIVLHNSAGTLLWTSTGSVPTNAAWRFRFARAKGTTTSNGTLHCDLYLGSDGKNTSPDSSYSATNVNAGTTQATELRVGYTSGGPGNLSVRNIQVETNSIMTIGPLTEPSSPPEPVLTKAIRQEFDLSTSPFTDSLQSVTKLSGPAITINSNLGAKTFNFLDSVGRTQPIVIRAVLQNAGGTVNYDITVPPLVRRVGMLYRISGAIA